MDFGKAMTATILFTLAAFGFGMAMASKAAPAGVVELGEIVVLHEGAVDAD